MCILIRQFAYSANESNYHVVIFAKHYVGMLTQIAKITGDLDE